jgi:hypothetical protein
MAAARKRCDVPVYCQSDAILSRMLRSEITLPVSFTTCTAVDPPIINQSQTRNYNHTDLCLFGVHMSRRICEETSSGGSSVHAASGKMRYAKVCLGQSCGSLLLLTRKFFLANLGVAHRYFMRYE